MKGKLYKDGNEWIVLCNGGVDFTGMPVVGQNKMMLHRDDVDSIHVNYVNLQEVDFEVVNEGGIRFAKLKTNN